MAQVKLIQNIAGGTTRSNIAKVGLGYSLNMYPETQDTSAHSCSILNRSIYGTSLAIELDGKCRGLFYTSIGKLYAVYGQTLYLVNNDNKAYTIGKLDTYDTFISFTETGGSNPYIVMADGTNVYAVCVTKSISEQAQEWTDHGRIALPYTRNTEYRIKPTHVAYCYNFLIVNDAASDDMNLSYEYPFETDEADFYDVFQTQSEAYLNYGFKVPADWCPDYLNAIISNGSYIYTFGPRSYQIFQWNNDLNYPFTCPNNTAAMIGLKAPNSLARMANDIFFLGSADVGNNAIYHINGTTIERISTNDIEREIDLVNDPQDAYAFTWTEHQHLFYAITFESVNLTFVYDLTEKQWHNRSSYNENNQQMFWNYQASTFAYDKVYLGTNGALTVMNENRYLEWNDRRILKLRRGAVLTNNNQPFYIDAAELIINNGQVTNVELNPRINIRYSWDGMTFSDYEDYYAGQIGQYEYSTMVWHLGLGRYFTLEISTTEEMNLCIENLKIQYEGTSLL